MAHLILHIRNLVRFLLVACNGFNILQMSLFSDKHSRHSWGNVHLCSTKSYIYSSMEQKMAPL